MKKYLLIFVSILLIVLLIVSIRNLFRIVKPFYEFNSETVTTTNKSTVDDKLHYQNQIQIEDFILSVSDDFKIATTDKDEEIVYLKEDYDCEKQFAPFKLQGAKLKQIIIIAETKTEKYTSNGTETFNIPLLFEGEIVKSVVLTLSSSESEKMELIIKRS